MAEDENGNLYPFKPFVSYTFHWKVGTLMGFSEDVNFLVSKYLKLHNRNLHISVSVLLNLGKNKPFFNFKTIHVAETFPC